MARRYTTGLLLIVALPLLVLAAAPDDKPGAKPAESPAPPKLERKNYTEKSSGFKLEVIDPDSDPPKTRKVDLAAKFDMVWVPGGEFTMGSPDAEPGRDADRRAATQGEGRRVLDGEVRSDLGRV